LESAAGNTDVICPSNSFPGIDSLSTLSLLPSFISATARSATPKTAFTDDVSATTNALSPEETNVPFSIDFSSTTPLSGDRSSVSRSGICVSCTTACAPFDFAWTTSIFAFAESALAWIT
jgi:hypothetical protein